jgi:YesN/AraC family two-component response regulator
VVTAENGQEAVDLYKENQISLVLSDLVMPGMGGRELYKVLRAFDPAVKMVFMTGYPPFDKGKDLGEGGVIAWVQKPISMEKISTVVKDALQRK